MSGAGCCIGPGNHELKRLDVLRTLALSLVALATVIFTGWRIYIEHNYLVEDLYFYMSLIPSGFLSLVVLQLLLTFITPSKCQLCCCNCNNKFYGLFSWCDPLLFFVVQVSIWVPFVGLGRVQVAHRLLEGNTSLENPQEVYDERLDLFDNGDWPWSPQEYNLDLIFVQSSFLVLVLIRAFLPRGGVFFSDMMKGVAFWMASALDLLAFLDDLNNEVLPHPYLAYAVVIAASAGCIQFLSMCTFMYYPIMYHENDKQADVKAARYRLFLTIIYALITDIPLTCIRVFILYHIYLPLKQISAIYFFFIVKSILFSIVGVTLAIVEGVKCTKSNLEDRTTVTPVEAISVDVMGDSTKVENLDYSYSKY
ncbi:uncharacterized protein LOC144442372 [Glandiceps talaboti]